MSAHDVAEPAPAEEPGYVLWPYIGSESVFFYPPGSVQEHLVTEHGIASVDVRRQLTGLYDHAGDHRKQMVVPTGAVGDLLALDHAHQDAA
jgi:hypothetical protein